MGSGSTGGRGCSAVLASADAPVPGLVALSHPNAQERLPALSLRLLAPREPCAPSREPVPPPGLVPSGPRRTSHPPAPPCHRRWASNLRPSVNLPDIAFHCFSGLASRIFPLKCFYFHLHLGIPLWPASSVTCSGSSLTLSVSSGSLMPASPWEGHEQSCHQGRAIPAPEAEPSGFAFHGLCKPD